MSTVWFGFQETSCLIQVPKFSFGDQSKVIQFWFKALWSGCPLAILSADTPSVSQRFLTELIQSGSGTSVQVQVNALN